MKKPPPGPLAPVTLEEAHRLLHQSIINPKTTKGPVQKDRPLVHPEDKKS